MPYIDAKAGFETPRGSGWRDANGPKSMRQIVRSVSSILDDEVVGGASGRLRSPAHTVTSTLGGRDVCTNSQNTVNYLCVLTCISESSHSSC